MFLFLILPILVAGFYICHNNPFHFYKLHRYEGQYLYLKSAQFGLYCLLAAITISVLFDNYISLSHTSISINLIAWLSSLIEHSIGLSNTPNPIADELAWSLWIALFTIIIAQLWCLLINLQLKATSSVDGKVLLMSSVLNDSPLDKLFFYSYVSLSPVMISLNDRKVYVGVVTSLGEPNEREGMDQEIEMVLTMSGYRDKETLNVIFDKNYDQVEDTSITVVLKQELVTSARIFDFEKYQRTQAGQSQQSA